MRSAKNGIVENSRDRDQENSGPVSVSVFTKSYRIQSIKKLEARVGIEPTHKGFADLSLTTWVPRLMGNMKREPWLLAWDGGQRHAAGAGDGGRTRDFDLGKVALYH
jgi:hypothetical protein